MLPNCLWLVFKTTKLPSRFSAWRLTMFSEKKLHSVLPLLAISATLKEYYAK